MFERQGCRRLSHMYFDQFKPFRDEHWHSGFIRSIRHQVHNYSTHLLSCEFNIHSYNDQCFVAHGIDFPDEVRAAVRKRKAEYLAGRIVVQHALSALGLAVAQQQVGIEKDRAPVWPKDIVGSISHTDEFAVCCVARAADISLIGVDSELILSASAASSLAAEIHNESELKLTINAGFNEAVGTSIIFSAKESLYKALYPVVRCYFGFEQARVSQLDLQRSSLTLTLCHAFASQYGLASDYTIQFSIKGALVHTLLMQ